MKKNLSLHIWLWKWHFIAGMIALPFIIVLAITGGIYLFKNDYQAATVAKTKHISPHKGATISLEKQKEVAIAHAIKKPHSIIINNNTQVATEFISGRFGGKSSIFINPYTALVNGEFIPRNALMFKVRKLHGELLLGGFGTKIIELIACWMIVLILTGLYIWLPIRQWSLKGLFTIRFKQGKQLLYRDLHAVIGFWFSILLLITLAGGLPWTDVFGSGFKWVQKVTHTGYPKTWSGVHVPIKANTPMLTLDSMSTIARNQHLEGIVQLQYSKPNTAIFSVSNTTTNFKAKKMLHFNAYSGELIKQLTWDDVGILMKARLWLMAFHQGEFGLWNWLLMLSVAIFLTLMSFAAILSYLKRKPKGNWGIPKVPAKFVVGKSIYGIMFLLSIMLPLFGISLLVILIFNLIKPYLKFNTMKSVINFLMISFFTISFTACNTLSKEEQQYDAIMQKVIDIHDEVMPKMGEVSSLIQKLEPKKDTTAQGKAYTAAQLDLKSAYDFMMDWMSDFSTKFPHGEEVTTEAVPEKLKLLKEEEVEVLQVKEKINSSIKKAKELLQQ
ncbi:PepSY-associated TM helix domain-containing protein [Aquimarina rhabdastrellae]